MATSSSIPFHTSGIKNVEEKEVKVGDIFYRAYGGHSKMWGRSFFVPAVTQNGNHQLINYWTAELLEKELNAAFWGNGFKFLLVVKANNSTPPLKYKIGTVVQGDYHGFEGKDTSPFTQHDFITPSGIFKEVQFDSFGVEDLKLCLDIVDAARPIKAGNYAQKHYIEKEYIEKNNLRKNNG